jgi:HlyD family secretion protein
MSKFLARYKLVLGAMLGVGVALPVFAFYRLHGVAVDVVPVQEQQLVQTVIATGRVMSPARVEIGSVITGRVAQVFVHEGDYVEAGQVLVELERHELEAALQQAEASEHSARARVATVSEVGLATAQESLAQARATLDWAERDLDRNRTLLSENVLSRAKFEDVERAYLVAKSQYEAARTQVNAQTKDGAQLREAEAKLAEAKAARQLAAAKLAQTHIRASTASTVLTRQVEPGDIVQPGKPLLTLATVGETRITAQIDEKNLPYLKVGETALASADAFPAVKFPAQLYYIAPGIDVGRGTVEVRFRIPEPPAHLRADMTLSVEVRGVHKENAIVIPLDAVRGSANGAMSVLTVYKGKAVSQPVAVGMKTGRQVEIVEGIRAGEQVIVDTAITPGRRVRPRLLQVQDVVEDAS